MIRDLNNKLVVILGPTASGKTDLSIKLAKKFGGQIVSADSRQVYKGLNIGSGKVTKKEMAGIPHHLLDVANPRYKFTVSRYQKIALKAIKNIQKKNALPFLVGGTGFYIQSIVEDLVIPEVRPNWELRKKLEKKNANQLFLMLKKIDPVRAATIDAKNPRRLIRALEIVITTGNPVPKLHDRSFSVQGQFDVLQIGIKKSPKELKKLIALRLNKRMKGIIKEVWSLRGAPKQSRVSFKRLEELGLEYRYVAQYIQGKLTYQQMQEKLQIESEHFAKRQMTWFKRDAKIHWVTNQQQTEKLVRKFIKK